MTPLGGAHDPLKWLEVRRRWVRLMAGHMPFGFASHFPGPSEYITLIRNPIDRMVSEYHYIRQHPLNPASSAARRLSLLEFVAEDHAFSRNCYARWLSNAAFGAKFQSDQEMVDTALRNLGQFSFIGITEQFGTAITHLCEKYELDPYTCSEQNRNRATPHRALLSREEHRAIERHNSLDLIIYEHCLSMCWSRNVGTPENSLRVATPA